MVATIVCAVLLLTVAYLAVVSGAEVLWWLRDHIPTVKRLQPQPSTVQTQRQTVSR